MRWLATWALGLLLISACGSGRLVISLKTPTEDSLNPLHNQWLSKFGLRLSAGGRTTNQDAVRGAETELVVGQVPVDTPFDLRLVGKNAADDMLGLGLVSNLQVSASDETEVPVEFRKAMGYIAAKDAPDPRKGEAADPAQDWIYILDPVAADLQKKKEDLPAIGLPGITHVASTPDGLTVLALTAGSEGTGSQLHSISTVDFHTRSPSPVALALEGTCLAVTADSRYVVVCHPDQGGSISIVDLKPTGKGQGPTVKSGLGGKPTAVAMMGDGRSAWVLLDGVSPPSYTASSAPSTGDCTLKSKLARLDRLDRLTASSTIPSIDLNLPVSAIAVDSRNGALLLALPCQDADSDGNTAYHGAIGRANQTDIMEKGRDGVQIPPKDSPDFVTRPYDIAVTEQGSFAMGIVPDAADAQVWNPDRSSVQTVKNFLPPVAGGLTVPGTTHGKLFLYSLPTTAAIHRLSVAPDGRRAIALFSVVYQADIPLPFQGCSNPLATTRIRAVGLTVVDLLNGSALARWISSLTFDACSVPCVLATDPDPPYALLDMGQPDNCRKILADSLRLQGYLFSTAFEPTSSTILFGSP